MNPSEINGQLDETRGFEPSAPADPMDDPRLLSAVQEYVAAVEGGRRPNRQEFLARHSDIAGELSVCLQGLAFVNSAMGEINGKPDPIAGQGEPLMGQPLGDFRLLREIGRGGMGVVYEATQLSLDRRVAVKVLPMAAALDARHLQRFRNEAQAAAQLHHNNIVPVYAVGCERSVHYYAMQLIDGQSLAEVIATLRDHRSESPADTVRSGDAPAAAVEYPPSSAKPRVRINPMDRLGMASVNAQAGKSISPDSLGNLTTLHSAKRPTYFRAVAKLALQAAEALYYAHQQGIVHRDIKPANLLLDGQGTLWITDFGLAQMYADNGLTQTGDTLGTFRYMSPEQASGRAVVLDQRTDIYSLGITMYELLTLERALPGTTREELMHQISSVDPRSPRSIDRKIPVELENIIGKASAKDAAERYPTARALADDLQRFLKDEPVLARPPSIVNKAVKWSRRHKTVTVSAGVILMLACAGSSVSSVLIAREQARTKHAYVLEQRRATEATEQRQLAVKNFDQARQAVDFLTSMAINELPTDPEFFQVRWRMLETSLAYYQSFLDQQKNDPSLSAQLEAAQSQVSAVLAELSAVDDLLRKNFAIRLLAEGSVQTDLNLNATQLIAAKNLASQVGSKPPTARPDSTDLTSEQIRQALSQDAAERETAIEQILTPTQVKRLSEISRQIRGVFALSDGDVAAAMAFTPLQKSAIRSACAEFNNRHHHGPKPFERDQDSERTDMAALMSRIEEILTARQLETWSLLTGQAYAGSSPPYEFWFSPHQHGRGGPDGPDRGPDGPDRGPGGNDQPPFKTNRDFKGPPDDRGDFDPGRNGPGGPDNGRGRGDHGPGAGAGPRQDGPGNAPGDGPPPG